MGDRGEIQVPREIKTVVNQFGVDKISGNKVIQENLKERERVAKIQQEALSSIKSFDIDRFIEDFHASHTPTIEIPENYQADFNRLYILFPSENGFSVECYRSNTGTSFVVRQDESTGNHCASFVEMVPTAQKYELELNHQIFLNHRTRQAIDFVQTAKSKGFETHVNLDWGEDLGSLSFHQKRITLFPMRILDKNYSFDQKRRLSHLVGETLSHETGHAFQKSILSRHLFEVVSLGLSYYLARLLSRINHPSVGKLRTNVGKLVDTFGLRLSVKDLVRERNADAFAWNYIRRCEKAINTGADESQQVKIVDRGDAMKIINARKIARTDPDGEYITNLGPNSQSTKISGI